MTGHPTGQEDGLQLSWSGSSLSTLVRYLFLCHDNLLTSWWLLSGTLCIVISEVWPISNRPYGIALGASSNWMNNFIVGQVTPDMLQGMHSWTYIFFGLVTLGGAFFIWLVVPETKALSLEEMDFLFGSVAARDQEIMTEIHREVGLSDLIEGGSGHGKESPAGEDVREVKHTNGEKDEI